MGWCGHRTRRR